MAQDLMNTQAFRGGPAAIFKNANIPHESLADGIGQSYPVVGYRGKVWSLRYRGEKKNIIRPDDGTPSSYLDVVILRAALHKSKSFYPAFDPNSDGEQPDCSSVDGLVPDRNVKKKQAEACALCPRNDWKTQPNGRKGRECADYKRVAVMLMPQATALLFGEPLMEPAFLRIPPASLQSLALMGEHMDSQGYEYCSYLTRITFDANEAHPKMVFKAMRPLDDAEGKVVLGLRDEPACKKIVDGETSHAVTGPVTVLSQLAAANALYHGAQTLHNPSPSIIEVAASVAPSPHTQPGTAQPATATSTDVPAPGDMAPLDRSSSFGVMPPNANPAPTPHVQPSMTNGSAATTSSPTPSFGAVAQQGPSSDTPNDAGEPVFADADLDARIANLLPTS